jgi:hypothetical protein
MRRVRLRARRGLTAAALCAALLGGCGGGDGAPRSGRPNLDPGQGPDLNTYYCADWQRASPAERRVVLERLKAFVGGTITGGTPGGERELGRGAVLDDELAYGIFDDRCREHYARGFLLYKLYTHAAAFAGRG